MRRPWITPVFVTLAVAAAPPSAAQEPAPPLQLLDRVVAVVGDSVILRSDIDVELFRLAAAGQPLPEDSAALAELRRQVLDAEINELLLVQAAVADTTIQVTDDRIESWVDQTVDSRLEAFGGEAGLRQALRRQGRTMEEYRDMLAGERRRLLLTQQYLAKMRQQRPPPPVTAGEIQDYFRANQDQFGERPATITFEQVVVATEASDSAASAARSVAEDLLRRLRTGEPDSTEFARLARQFSEDPGTRERGGDLGWFRPSRMVQAFAEAVRSMRPGEISDIVESSFGYHIIKLEQIRGAERRARHILLRAEVTEADETRARRLADSIADAIRAGASVDSLIERYSDPSERSRVGPFPRSELPSPYGTALADADTGDVVGPIRLSGSATGPKWAVVSVTDSQEAGEYTLDDVRTRIRDQLRRQKMMEEVLSTLRERTFIDIRI